MIDISCITPMQLSSLIASRSIFLWGASIVGSGICRSLERNGMRPTGFIDSSPRLNGKRFLGYPVFAPTEILLRSPTEIFVVLTSGHYEHELRQLCLENGLVAEKDFISSRAISPLDPSVDISGVCNLRCISCPRGNIIEQPPAGFMQPDVYKSVLDKLLKELPFVGNVQLYAWGEPLLNPAVAEIIHMTVDRQVLCAISTNLNVRKDFSEAIKARPDWIKVSASGYGPNYERTHTGGSWKVLHANMHTLAKLRQQHHPDMYVEVNYHMYKHNIGTEYDNMKALCESLGFVFRPNHAYLYSLDNVLAYREGKELSQQARETLAMLLLDIDTGLAKAKAQKELPCAEERCFPINWNLNVRFCGSYFKPILAENFLREPLSEIIARRNNSSFCAYCKSMALHRFTGVYLQEAHPVRKEQV